MYQMNKTKKVVAFSVYGDDPVYSSGAIANAVAVGQFFPGWTARFYVDDSLPADLFCRLTDTGAEVVRMKRNGVADGMFWRFLPACDESIDAFVVRDADALLCPRNKYVVDEWLESGKQFHIVRDHPHHKSLILGGLWGGKGGLLPEIDSQIADFLEVEPDEYGADIRFLSKCIYPLIADSVLIHSDYVAFGDECVVPIRSPRLNDQWLGFPPMRGDVTLTRCQAFRALSDRGLVRLDFPAWLQRG